MPPRKRSRKGGKSVSTAINEQDLDQLIASLEDFDMQFEARFRRFEELFEEQLKAVERHYAIERSKIPLEILNSKLIGNENSNSTTIMEGTFQEADSILHSRHRKRSRSAEVTSFIVSTDSRQVTRSSSLNSRKKMPNLMTSTTIGIFQTSAVKSTFASAPSLITPKVQPNVPLSVVRHPRQGELAFSTSGSPLVVTSTAYEQTANLNIRLADGRVVSILPAPTLCPYDIPQVNEETMKQLLNLRKHMDTFINQTKF